MRGMRKWKRWAVFLLLFVVLAVGGSRTAQAEMLNMTDFQSSEDSFGTDYSFRESRTFWSKAATLN